jgi:hypothetical protein
MHILVLKSNTGLNIKRNGVALVLVPLNHHNLKKNSDTKELLYLISYLRNKFEVCTFAFFKEIKP